MCGPPSPAPKPTFAELNTARRRQAEKDFLARPFRGKRCLACTLTFRQEKALSYGIVAKLNERLAFKQYLRLMKALNRKVYGHRFTRQEIKLADVPCIEFGVNGDNLHIHAAIEIPDHWSKTKLETWIEDWWRTRSRRLGRLHARH